MPALNSFIRQGLLSQPLAFGVGLVTFLATLNAATASMFSWVLAMVGVAQLLVGILMDSRTLRYGAVALRIGFVGLYAVAISLGCLSGLASSSWHDVVVTVVAIAVACLAILLACRLRTIKPV